MGIFWVVGGEYKDTAFNELVHDTETWIGPFQDYESARQEWLKHAWQSVDNCNVRYRIERIDTDQPPPCTD
ncbi:MAG: DUF4170 domain-containing protein [Alphaproteobacteria bacterium]|nr:MAG: DUF4170 domain-containing protein [Alphaproteobacteria bacterium]